LPYAEKILADVTEARLRMEKAHGGTSASWGLEPSRPLQPISCRRCSSNSRAVSANVNVLLREESTTPLGPAAVRRNRLEYRAAPAALGWLKPWTLFTEEFRLTVSAEHPLHDPGSVSLSKLKREKYCIRTPGTIRAS
jgi:hypothetical protein